MAVINHFLDQYRLITQDPWVRRVDHELDLYLIDDAIGRIPDALRSATTSDVLRALNTIPFAKEVNRWRSYTYRLNTIEDLWPGPVLEEPFRATFAQMAKVPYEVPLHYDLILEAQGQLKRRNYHLAIIEAETAFEVYVADLLVRLKTTLGELAAPGLRNGYRSSAVPCTPSGEQRCMTCATELYTVAVGKSALTRRNAAS